MSWEIRQGDCIELMRAMEPESVDAIVCDPPYGLGFMGKAWDTIGDVGRGARARTERAAEVTPVGEGHSTSGGPYLAAGVDSLRSAGRPFQSWCESWATEALRVLKPGGHLLAFGGTRTYHRLTAGIEDAGFEIRDCLAWMYGSGFPKSLDVSKAIDKAAGAEREVVGTRTKAGMGSETTFAQDAWTQANRGPVELEITKPATAEAAEWQGWGTALKPAHEPIVLARKPLAGTVAGNVLEFGTGALNVDGTRIEHAGADDLEQSLAKNPGRDDTVTSGTYGADRPQQSVNVNGRWPANAILDEEAGRLLDEQSGELSPGQHPARRSGIGYGSGAQGTTGEARATDSGGASRFFYCAKASSAERGEGNTHPTVKPVALMQWLVRLVTPGGGLVLDPFAGSGSTGIAATREGFSFIGLEREAEYVAIARRRIMDDAPLFNAGAEVVA